MSRSSALRVTFFIITLFSCALILCKCQELAKPLVAVTALARARPNNAIVITGATNQSFHFFGSFCLSFSMAEYFPFAQGLRHVRLRDIRPARGKASWFHRK